MGLFDWLRRLTQSDDSPESTSPSEVPQRIVEWTTDMNIALPDGRTLEELVDFIMDAILHGRDHEQIVSAVYSQFGLSKDNAEIAVDRVCGRMFRAQIRANCPDRSNDPLAWLSFQRTSANR